VDGVEVEVRHHLEKMSARRACCDRNSHRMIETFGVLVTAEHCIHGWRSVEMSDLFFLEQTPDVWIVDLSKTVVRSSNSSDCPREGPACGD